MNEQTVWDLMIEEISVTRAQHETARRHAMEVDHWLKQGGGRIGEGIPRTFIHGSFRLGTAIRPIGPEGSYDVDLGCELTAADVRTWMQQEVKHAVGDRLKENPEYDRILRKQGAEKYEKGSRRCWTLEYPGSENFHLDTLPAVPDAYTRDTGLGERGFGDTNATAMRLTDTKEWEKEEGKWPCSNPEGYAEWFHAMAGRPLREAIERLGRETGRRAEAWETRSALQDVVKLLKRHRDQTMGGDDDKPISIVITTLAGQVFKEEWDTVACMRRMPTGMRYKLRQDSYEVRNPVDHRENFTDKWREEPRKQRVFMEWLDRLERDCQHVLAEGLLPEQRLRRAGGRWNINEDRLLEAAGTRGVVVGAGAVATAVKEPRIEPGREQDRGGAKPWRRDTGPR